MVCSVRHHPLTATADYYNIRSHNKLTRSVTYAEKALRTMTMEQLTATESNAMDIIQAI